jgi:hypothetical protein
MAGCIGASLAVRCPCCVRTDAHPKGGLSLDNTLRAALGPRSRQAHWPGGARRSPIGAAKGTP